MSEKVRPLHEIADEIKRLWRPIYFAAQPYVNEMQKIAEPDDKVGFYEYGTGMVLGFLGNAQTWRGEDAKRIKEELRNRLKIVK